MRKTKMIMATLSALFFAVSSNFIAKADTVTVENNPYVADRDTATKDGENNNIIVPPNPETAAVEDTTDNVIGPGVEQPAEEEANQTPQLSIGEQVVTYASQFLGNPYVYGGTSLTNGADCSGFVLKVYEQFGVSLPRTSREQGRVGVDVGGLENALPGDIVSYAGHIGIYQGQNKLVHSSNPRDGIKISPVTFKPILSVRRVV